MRSMKVEPGAAVIFTLIQSERTVVPPVTAERSPPASRMTGADSPVMADSLTEATPSMISPSPGMRSPASTRTTSLIFRSSAETPSTTSFMPLFPLGSINRLARVSERVLRRASACAFPRPSATASAKLAKSTVNHSQAAIWPVNSAVPFCAMRSRRKIKVTKAETTSVTKMTGLRASWRGSSFRNASIEARLMMAGSKRPGATTL